MNYHINNAISGYIGNLDQKDCQGLLPIMNAAHSKNYYLVKLLLDNGADPNDALHISILHDSLLITELFLQYGADPNKFKDHRFAWPYPIDNVYVRDTLNIKMLELLFRYGAYPYTSLYENNFSFLSGSIVESHYVVIDSEFWKSVKKRYIPVGLTLSHLSAEELLAILDFLCSGAEYLNHNKKWTLITAIKHF